MPLHVSFHLFFIFFVKVLGENWCMIFSFLMPTDFCIVWTTSPPHEKWCMGIMKNLCSFFSRQLYNMIEIKSHILDFAIWNVVVQLCFCFLLKLGFTLVSNDVNLQEINSSFRQKKGFTIEAYPALTQDVVSWQTFSAEELAVDLLYLRLLYSKDSNFLYIAANFRQNKRFHPYEVFCNSHLKVTKHFC